MHTVTCEKDNGYTNVRPDFNISGDHYELSAKAVDLFEDYLNAVPMGEDRPWVSYRPDVPEIGSMWNCVFPSPRTGRALSKRTIQKILKESAQS